MRKASTLLWWHLPKNMEGRERMEGNMPEGVFTKSV